MGVGRVAILVAVLLSAAIAPGVGAGQTSAPDADRTVTTIEVHPDGTAVWTVEVWTRLEDDAAVERFREFQTAFRENTSRYLAPFETRIRNVVTQARNATGRDMQATDFTAETRVQEVPRRWGITEYQFRWEGFAREADDTLRVGDVFEGGYYLTPQDTLRIEHPESLERTAVDPQPETTESRAVEWTGEMDFDDGRPHLVLTDTTTETADTTTGPGNTTTTPAVPVGPEGRSWLLPVGFLAILGLLAVGGYVITRRENHAVEPRVTTDAEAVESLLEANQGRMKQAMIADELDWTPSKTSRVLSSMEEDGRIERTRIGRENLVSLRED